MEDRRRDLLPLHSVEITFSFLPEAREPTLSIVARGHSPLTADQPSMTGLERAFERLTFRECGLDGYAMRTLMERSLDSRRVGCVHRLQVIGCDHPFGNGCTQLLTERLNKEKIPLLTVGVRDSTRPLTTLMVAKRHNIQCLEVERVVDNLFFALNAEYWHAIPCIVYHTDARSLLESAELLLLHDKRSVLHLTDAEWDISMFFRFLGFILGYFTRDDSNGQKSFPKDLLLVTVGGGSRPEWQPLSREGGAQMDEWWREAAEGETPLHDYYRLLEGCEWVVSRMPVKGRTMKMMQRLRGGAPSVKMAVHLEFVRDNVESG